MILELHRQIDIEEGRAPKEDEMDDANAYQSGATDTAYTAGTAWNGDAQSPNGVQPSATSPWAAVAAPNHGGRNGGAASPWGSGPTEPAANASSGW